MSLTNSSLPIQTVSNTSSNYFVTVQNFTQGQTNKETVSSSLLWKNNDLLIDSEKVKFLPTSNAFTTFTTSGTPPRNAKPDDTWYDTASDIIFRYIDDGDGTFQWVDVSGLSNFGNLVPGPNPIKVFYLVVGGGGGGGGNNCGNGSAFGGGAGGLLSGTVCLTENQSYTITVGGGGAGGLGGVPGTTGPTGITNPGVPGANSSIANAAGSCGNWPISTITAVGGGAGAGTFRVCGGPALPAQPTFSGGSGGGGYRFAANTGSLAIGSPGFGVAGPQGYPGGSAVPGAFFGTKAGGGGAGGKGGNTSSCGALCGPGLGNGGAGYTWPFTANTYAGGGGGGQYQEPFALNGLGGTGGGGRGGYGSPGPTPPFPAVAASPGTIRTGGGGGGAGIGGGPPSLNATGGSGGSGVVIIAVANGNIHQFQAPGAFASNPPAAPGYTLLTFNAPGITTSGSFTLRITK